MSSRRAAETYRAARRNWRLKQRPRSTWGGAHIVMEHPGGDGLFAVYRPFYVTGKRYPYNSTKRGWG
jgi:hypothetical protein